MSPRSRRPTMQDVAHLAQVSVSTVSLVLTGLRTGDERISLETRQRVLDAIAKLGYVPNQAARALRRSRTERVCLVLPHLGIPTYALLAQQLDVAAKEHGYTTVIAVGGSAERESRVFDQLRRHLADGAIIIMECRADYDLSQLAQAGLALVLISNFDAPPGVDVVHTTEEAASYEAVRFLVAKGHRRVGFIGDAGRGASPWRFKGYRRALDEFGITANDCLSSYYETGTREQAYRCAAQIINGPERPTAIFAGTDLAAISAIWAARDAGLRIPDDMAVIGAGNIPEGAITRPPLTTIGPVNLGQSAAFEMLFSRLAGQSPPEGRTHVIKWQLFDRGSA